MLRSVVAASDSATAAAKTRGTPQRRIPASISTARRFGRTVWRRLAAQVEGLVQCNPNRQRQVVVRQLAQQQAIQGTAVADVGNAAYRQVLVVRERSRQVDGGQQLAGDPRHAAQFLVIVEPRDQSPRQFGRRQIDVRRLDELVQPRAAPQPELLGVELLEPLMEAAQIAQHAVEAARQVSLWRQHLGDRGSSKGPSGRLPLLPASVRIRHSSKTNSARSAFADGVSPQLGGQGMHGVQLQEEFSEPIRELAALRASSRGRPWCSTGLTPPASRRDMRPTGAPPH